MLLVKLENTGVVYPYSTNQLKKDNPDTSFPTTFNEELLGIFSVFKVVETTAPLFDPINENAEELTPIFIDGAWTQQWGVTAATPEQIAERKKALVPSVVSMRQARLALLQSGLLDSVETFMLSAPAATKIEWEYATEVNRNYGLVLALAAQLNLSEEDIDNLFITAGSL